MTESFGRPSRVVKVWAPPSPIRVTPPPVVPTDTPALSTQSVRTRKLSRPSPAESRRKREPSRRKSPSSSVPTQSAPRPSRARAWIFRPVRPSPGPNVSNRPPHPQQPAAVCPDPERAVRVGEQGDDGVRGELGVVRRSKRVNCVPSKRTSPSCVPIQRYPSGVWAIAWTVFWGGPGPPPSCRASPGRAAGPGRAPARPGPPGGARGARSGRTADAPLAPRRVCPDEPVGPGTIRPS